MNSDNAFGKKVWSFLSVCILLLGAGSVALGQAGRGSISGLVTDPAGAVVPGSRIVLLNKATGVTQHTVTSGGGLYTFISLNPGVYQVTASQTGFKSVAQEKVTVNVDEVTQVNITLEVGAATETVTVTEGVTLVEPTNSTVGSLIGSETIDRVPLVSRNVYDLIQLSAGVNAVNGSPNSSDSMQSVQNISVGRPGVDVSADTINGSLVGSVYYMLDGAPIGIAENNSAAIIPAMNIPEDGIDEVRVETQNTPASYQSGGAGAISLVSKSGTNKLHGDVFGVFRPNALSANDYFNKDSEIANGQANTPPSFYRYQEGGAIGGAIKKDKLFFFGDYEDTQQQQFEGLKTYNVPTSLERTGNFSQMGFTIYDPTQPDNPDGTRRPFKGNIILNPNPIALLFLANMPKCNYPSPSTCDQATTDLNSVGYNYAVPGLDPLHAHRFDVRVDWAKSEKQRIFTRFSYDRLVFSTANVFPSPGWDPDYALNTTNGRSALVADDLTLNASTVLNLRYSFTRRYEHQGGPASYSSTDITNLGTVNGTQVGFPAALAAQQVAKQLPFMLFDDFGGGVGGTADYNNFIDASENSDASATITKIHGKHEISTGFEWMKRYFNVGQPYAPAGTYSFGYGGTDQQTSPASGNLVGGSDYASMLIGMGDSGEFDRAIFPAESNPYYAAFVEDTYHATPKLTITAGLRWDIFGGRNERYNRQEYFEPNATNTVNNVSYTGAEVYVNSSNRSPFKTNLHDFGPRLAFAWQPVQHFVVRGGAGFYYGPSTEMVASGSLNTDGFSSSTGQNTTCQNADGSGNWAFYGTSSCINTTGNPTLPVGDFTAAYSLSNPYPNGLIPIFTTAPAGLANNLGVSINTVQHVQRTPTTYNFNFGLEYELPHQVVVSAAYVGSRGLFMPFSSVDQNMLDLGTIAKNGDSLCFVTNPSCQYVTNTWAPIQPSTNGWSGYAKVPLWVSLEKYPQFNTGGFGSGVVTNGYPAGDSEYSSLQTKVQKRLTGHFTTLATFTWSKLMTDDGNPPLGFVGSHNGSVQDWRNLRYDHAISPQDVKYSFTGQVSYDLPVGKGMAVNLNGVSNAILGGWTVNGILYLSTGVPIHSPGSGDPLTPFSQRSDMVCNPAQGAPHTVNDWFNINCFVQPGTDNGGNPNPYIPGTAPDYLDNVRTRGARNLDLSVYKTFKFTETKALRFDISGYNMTNFAQYGYPSVNSVVGVASEGQSFGVISGNVNTPRQFQFGARFTF
ncbi:Cna protein B-type domain protein [Candidatus Sulfotelmatobacter kueseliae]|uniref:Cna protein B-type domain protein n=1 Tax=Candidatus Sulfotelmatobacter kueseliae TaxID=2042962 RepID=A0A2U3KE56_9BACT|nr:Cna protein B-type domain protein [Candidatus Sulfotelmatobacter kueseliae]